MSRSVRKRPCAAWCGGSQKKDKRICNRIMRRRNRVAIRAADVDVVEFLTKRTALNVYSMSQDGSRHWESWLSYQHRRYPLAAADYRAWFRWAKAK